MARQGAGGRGAAPASWVIGLVVVLCGVLLLKWIALVALAAFAVLSFVRWARGGSVDRERGVVIDLSETREPEIAELEALEAPRSDPHPVHHTSADDCRWCGLAGGHRDGAGRLLRPRHVHVLH